MMDAYSETATTKSMRRLLFVAAMLVFIMGIPLFIASTATDTFFAWTIATPLTAAFLGASYWAAGVLELMASRESAWSNARIAVPAVFIFTTLTFIITMMHIDRFHLAAESPITLTVTWAWIVVYAVVPVLMAIIMAAQARSGARDMPRTLPLSQATRLMLVAQGVILGVTGLALLLVPVTVSPLWPWGLTPLTGRAIGAWLFSVGFAVIHAAWENDHRRIRALAVSYLVLVILQCLALARFAGDFAWGTLSGVLYLAFLAWMVALGVVLNLTRQRMSGVPGYVA